MKIGDKAALEGVVADRVDMGGDANVKIVSPCGSAEIWVPESRLEAFVRKDVEKPESKKTAKK